MLVAKRYNFILILIGIALFAGLYLSSLYHYLLFHGIAEIFSIVVAISIFILVWNLRQYLDNNYLLFLGVAYLFVGCIDVVHTLAYKGMGIFQIYEANLSTQLWIANRYLESISFVIASYFIGRKLKANILLIVYSVTTCIILSSIFAWHIFPVCYVEGVGLTPFKIMSEYIISSILVLALHMLMRKRHAFDKNITLLLAASIMITIASELAFTLYIDVYGFANFLGHIFKILSFYLIYKAIVKIGIRQPFALFFRDLKKKEDLLISDKESLEKAVSERTIELEKTITKLRNAELCYRTVADFTYDWEYWEGADGKYQYISPSCERITGYKQEEFIKNVELLREIIINEDRAIWDQHRRDTSQHPALRELQFRIKRRDGEIRWIEHVCRQVEANDGTFLGFRASNRDITERKRIQDELYLLKDELIHATRMMTMGEITAALAHELNQPLAAIMSNAQAAQRFLNNKNPALDEVKEILSDIAKDNMRAGDIIRKLRLLLKKDKSEFSKLNINKLIHEVLFLLRSDFIIRKIPLKKDLDKDIPPVFGDKIQLQQVFFNFILNAFEALKDTKKDLKEITIVSKCENRKEVRVSIRDSGCGLDEGTLDRLFEPFFTTKKEGMGMGLAINKTIIQIHGGRLWAENNPDRGATFYITLPVIKEKTE